MPRPDDTVAAAWQAATTLREHRGDGHVALLTSAGLDGCEALVLAAACETLPPDLLQRSRGWSADDWQAAVDRLAHRDLVTGDGGPTVRGLELREDIERRTDALADAAYRGIGEAAVDDLIRLLEPAARRIAGSGEISYPNPMGLPAPGQPRR